MRFFVCFVFALLLGCMRTYSQSDRSDNYRIVNERIADMHRTLKEEVYFSTYEAIEYTLPIVEDKKQLNDIVKIMKKLKRMCPQKPKSVCECYEAKIRKGEKIDDEILFWNGCKDLILY